MKSEMIQHYWCHFLWHQNTVGVKQQFTLSVVCVTTSHIDTFLASLMPQGWHWMLVGFLAKLLAGLRQVLAAWCAGLVVFSTVCPFRPTRARLVTIRGTSRPSHHQHILMSEKIHDGTCNVWSSIVLLKGHVPSLTRTKGSTCGLATSSR